MCFWKTAREEQLEKELEDARRLHRLTVDNFNQFVVALILFLLSSHRSFHEIEGFVRLRAPNQGTFYDFELALRNEYREQKIETKKTEQEKERWAEFDSLFRSSDDVLTFSSDIQETKKAGGKKNDNEKI